MNKIFSAGYILPARCALMLSSSVLGMALSAATAQAAEAEQQVAPDAQGAPAPQTVQVADNQAAPADAVIVVSGIRASLEDALEIRRNADVILDGISSDDIGSTPDLNLGEALQRIPGVQINREEERRNALISVRGLPGRFTKTTVQGVR